MPGGAPRRPVSKAQARFFRAVASGEIKRPGFSKKEAAADVKGFPTHNLPEKVKRKKGK